MFTFLPVSSSTCPAITFTDLSCASELICCNLLSIASILSFCFTTRFLSLPSVSFSIVSFSISKSIASVFSFSLRFLGILLLLFLTAVSASVFSLCYCISILPFFKASSNTDWWLANILSAIRLSYLLATIFMLSLSSLEV